MNLNYSEEQVMLREQIQKFCESEYDFYTREKIVKSSDDFDSNVWKLFAPRPLDMEQIILAKAKIVNSITFTAQYTVLV